MDKLNKHWVRDGVIFARAEIKAHEINDEIDMIEYQRANVQTSPFMIPGEDEHVDCNEARAALRQDEEDAHDMDLLAGVLISPRDMGYEQHVDNELCEELIEQFEVLRPKQTFFS